MLVALGSAFLAWRGLAAVKLQRDALQLELDRERDRTRSEQTAHITVAVTAGPVRPERMLQVVNRGPGRADKVRVYLDGQPITEHSMYTGASGGGPPTDTIVPGDRIGYPLYPSGQDPPTSVVRVEWIHEHGEAGAYSNRVAI